MEFALAAVTAAGAGFLLLGWLSLQNKLPSNAWAGIRTPYTRSSDEAWYATHRAAAPILVWGGVAVLAAGLAFLPFALAGKLGDALTTGVVVALAVMIGATAVAGWVYGTRTARSSR